jgi:hypothetical protein
MAKRTPEEVEAQLRAYGRNHANATVEQALEWAAADTIADLRRKLDEALYHKMLMQTSNGWAEVERLTRERDEALLRAEKKTPTQPQLDR